MAGEICPNTGDTDDCKEKTRCRWGECEGQQLPEDPNLYCPSGYDFREDYCDCSPVAVNRQWRFYIDYYAVSEPGSGCCIGYTLAPKVEIDSYRDFGVEVVIVGSSRLGNTKLGYTKDGTFINCRVCSACTHVIQLRLIET